MASLGGDLEARYRAAGWADADVSPEAEQVPSEKPAIKRTASRKKSK